MKKKNLLKIFILSILIIFVISAPLFAQTKTVNANEIISKINKGENIYYENCKIVGELDFTKIKNTAKLYATSYSDYYISYVDVHISFNNCVFEGRVTSNSYSNNSEIYTIFTKAVSFRNSTFESELNLVGTQFQSVLNCEGITTNGYCNFWNSDFMGDVIFRYSNFNSGAYFDSACFRGLADFSSINIRSDLSFYNANFEGQVYLTIYSNDGY